MVSEQDWKAVCDSEIFREFVAQELQKEAHEESQKQARQLEDLEKQAEEEERMLDAFADLNKEILKNEPLRKKLVQARNYINAHPEVLEKTDENFVNGLMMLDLGE